MLKCCWETLICINNNKRSNETFILERREYNTRLYAHYYLKDSNHIYMQRQGYMLDKEGLTLLILEMTKRVPVAILFYFIFSQKKSTF